MSGVLLAAAPSVSLGRFVELLLVLRRRVFGPYSMDIVASTAFSVDIDSINHPSDAIVTNIKDMVKINFTNPLIVLVGTWRSIVFSVVSVVRPELLIRCHVFQFCFRSLCPSLTR